jgi:hypothetical protein
MLQFKEMATATLDSVRKNVMALPDVFGGLSDTVSTYASETNQIWPYVTYPEWQRLGAHVRGLTNTMVVSLDVNVKDPQAWINYSQAHSEIEISPIIFQMEADGELVPKMDGKEEVTVLWHMAFDPAYATGKENLFYNHNFLVFKYFSAAVDVVKQLRHGVISPFMEIVKKSESETAGSLKSVSNKVSPSEDPRGVYLAPVFDSFAEDATIVGYIEGIIAWSIFFKNVLLNKNEGLYCTVRNTCDQVHTWLLDGSGPRYIGPVSIINTICLLL